MGATESKQVNDIVIEVSSDIHEYSPKNARKLRKAWEEFRRVNKEVVESLEDQGDVPQELIMRAGSIIEYPSEANGVSWPTTDIPREDIATGELRLYDY